MGGIAITNALFIWYVNGCGHPIGKMVVMLIGMGKVRIHLK
jgi:hypothetical protein